MTTPDRVKMTAPHLKSVPNEELQVFIDDAVEEVSKLSIKNKERAQRYLTAHLATLAYPLSYKESVGEISRSVFRPKEKGLGRTEYGEEYGRLISSGGAWLRTM